MVPGELSSASILWPGNGAMMRRNIAIDGVRHAEALAVPHSRVPALLSFPANFHRGLQVTRSL